MFPQFSAQYRSMGVGGYAIIHRFEDVYQYLGSVTKIIGGHTIKAGAEFRKIQENYYQPNLPGGGFTFNRKQTGLNPLSSSSSQGDGLASALLGFGSSGTVSIDYPTAQSSGYAGAYVNDDWRVSRKLTVNFGVRWDADIPRTDRFNRINWLDISAPAPIADNPQVKAVFPNLLGADAVRGSRRPHACTTATGRTSSRASASHTRSITRPRSARVTGSSIRSRATRLRARLARRSGLPTPPRRGALTAVLRSTPRSPIRGRPV